MSNKINIIGIGANGTNSLSKTAVDTLVKSDVIFGGIRHLDMIETKAEKTEWISPFKDNIEIVKKEFEQNKQISIIATGDVNWFGVAKIITKHFGKQNINIINNVGAFSLASIKMGWSIQDVNCLSIHGRKLNSIIPKLYNGAKLIVLTNDKNSPIEICNVLKDNNLNDSKITVLNELGANSETVQEFIANNPQLANSDLNVVAIDVVGLTPSLTGGLNDDLLINDGQLTKREVRAITMSSLQPYPNAILWDIGSGSGSISIEWARLGGISHAFEKNEERFNNIKQNIINLGVENNVYPYNSTIDKEIDTLQSPDCIFVGGGLTSLDIDILYNKLKTGGRLVINTVSMQGSDIINKVYQKYGGSISRINIERNSKVGSFDTLKPMASVIHFYLIKE
ncbi:MAG: precorrin-6y C5,15-methyltransferase (decarboxylating) subunit CbiE [Alphaproteobacteria bacterium]